MFGHFLNFALYGSWEAVHSLKILSRDVGTFSTIGSFILRTFIFWLFRPFSNLPTFSQLRSKKWPCHGSMLKPDPSRKMRDEILCRGMPEILRVLSPKAKSWPKRCPRMAPILFPKFRACIFVRKLGSCLGRGLRRHFFTKNIPVCNKSRELLAARPLRR